ncbi:hypothetical protein [Xanthomonas sacchari]|uniref:hypothetical protein n=1 Tax=Xanthomonas sacchari TaxID=56458 RepID=UPI0022537C2E|nr:hypothetical protein [Xanthomonas sacchari]UYK70996.1 hypothetical protein NG828_12060 [Xanthomonas sacchari]
MFKNRKKIFAFSFFIISAIVFIVIYRWILFIDSGELGEKDVLSSLQQVELKHRVWSDKSSPILLGNVSPKGYSFIGLPTYDPDFPRVWIVLNQGANDHRVRMVPDNMRFYVSCNYLGKLRLLKKVDKYVLVFLERNCVRDTAG